MPYLSRKKSECYLSYHTFNFDDHPLIATNAETSPKRLQGRLPHSLPPIPSRGLVLYSNTFYP